MASQQPISIGPNQDTEGRSDPGDDRQRIPSQDRKSYIDAGMNGFINKPVEPSIMYSILLAGLKSR